MVDNSWSLKGYSFLTWLQKKKEFIIENKEAVKNSLVGLLTIMTMIQMYSTNMEVKWLVGLMPIVVIALKWVIDTFDFIASSNPK